MSILYRKIVILLVGQILVSTLSLNNVEANQYNPTYEQAKAASSKVNQRDVDRIKGMFRDSQRLATDSLFELNALEQLKHNFNVHNKASINGKGPLEITEENNLLVHRDDKNGEKQYQISTVQNKQSNGSQNRILGANGVQSIMPTADIVIKEVDMTKKDSSERPEKSSVIDERKGNTNSRQSNIFSGFTFPGAATFPNPLLGGAGGLNSNPFLTNLMRSPTLPTLPGLPTLPPLPKFPLATPKPPRPPKSSVIGNNGGTMALTNDNVVVVNVLSNNYR